MAFRHFRQRLVSVRSRKRVSGGKLFLASLDGWADKFDQVKGSDLDVILWIASIPPGLQYHE